MAIVRKIKVKQEDGSAAVYDIGTNAANVVMQSGGDLETEIGDKVSQDLVSTTVPATVSKPKAPLAKGANAFYPVTTADQIKKADGTPLEVNGKLQIEDAMKVWSFTVAAANWVDETVEGVAMKKNVVAATGMTANTFLTSFQLDSVDATNEEAKKAAMTWKYCDTSNGQIIFYGEDAITSDFHITAIEPYVS